MKYESGISNGVAFRSNVFLRAIPFEIPACGKNILGGGGVLEKKYVLGGRRKNMHGGVPEKKTCGEC